MNRKLIQKDQNISQQGKGKWGVLEQTQKQRGELMNIEEQSRRNDTHEMEEFTSEWKEKRKEVNSDFKKVFVNADITLLSITQNFNL